MQNSTKTCLELLEVVEQQSEIVAKKDETIRKLVNQNLEQENLINALLKDMEVE